MLAETKEAIPSALAKYLDEWTQQELRTYVQDSLQDYLYTYAGYAEIEDFIEEWG